MSVAAIIPARDEEKTIYNLVKVFKNSGLFSEIFTVNDGSRDRTEFLARKAGATVINLLENSGKGEALNAGVRASRSPVLLFFDADLSGVTKKHLEALVNPVLSGEADMVIGIQAKWKDVYEKHESVPILSGQRALRREIFEAVPEKLREGYQIEEALNYYAKTGGWKTRTVVLDGIKHLQKIPKSNVFKGLGGYLKMGWQVAKIFMVVRLIKSISFKK